MATFATAADGAGSMLWCCQLSMLYIVLNAALSALLWHGFPPLCLQAGEQLSLEWERGRVFDQDIGGVFAAAVRDAGSLRVGSVSTKEERKPRPPGLNTVELLKVASSALNIGPAQAMAVRLLFCNAMLLATVLCTAYAVALP